jgi:energy-coupling factor transporter transmembrane protein EcfT
MSCPITITFLLQRAPIRELLLVSWPNTSNLIILIIVQWNARFMGGLVRKKEKIVFLSIAEYGKSK